MSIPSSTISTSSATSTACRSRSPTRSARPWRTTSRSASPAACSGTPAIFELVDVNPSHLDITVHDCVYLKSCQTLIDEGFSIRDLTCARIGCFRAAVKALANIDCDYQVTSFNIDGDCKGYIERI